jgi:hypothetical protein
MYLLYIFPPELHTLMTRCSNFFNPPKKNSFDCAANRQKVIGKAKDLSAPLLFPFPQLILSNKYYNKKCRFLGCGAM